MARIRTIKPEFFTSESILSIEPLARLLFIGLWCESDRDGRLAWKPKTLKFRYLPADNVDMDDLTEQLVSEGMILIYSSDGHEYCWIPSFSNHQVINNRESKSVIPPHPYDDGCGSKPSKIPTSTRRELLNEHSECCRCGDTEDLTIDHILPQSCGGSHDIENLRVMCRSCNASRPVSGLPLRRDLESDGYDFDDLLLRVGTRQSTNERVKAEGKEGRKGKEGNGTGDSLDYEKIKEIFNSTLTKASSVAKLTDKRKRLVKKLFTDFSLDYEKFTNYLSFLNDHPDTQWMFQKRPKNDGSGQNWNPQTFEYFVGEKCFLNAKENLQ